MSLFDDKQADIIAAFNTTSRYLEDILNMNYIHFNNMLRKIYYEGLQLNKANASDTEVSFFDLYLFISNDSVIKKPYENRDDSDFDFEIVNFLF